MKFHRRLLLTIFTVLFFFTLGWDVWLYTLESHTTPWNYLHTAIFGIVFLIGGIASVIGAIRFGLGSNVGKMLVFLGFAMLCYWAGNVLWAYYAIFLRESNPDNTLIDVFYILLYPFGVAGMWYLLRLYQNQITARLIRDLSIILAVSFIIIFSLFTLPVFSPNVPFIIKFSNAYFIFGDVVIFSIVLVVLYIGRTHKSLYIFALGLFFVVVGDIFFAYRKTVGSYWHGDISDILYTTGAYFAVIGFIEIIHSLYQATQVREENKQ